VLANPEPLAVSKTDVTPPIEFVVIIAVALVEVTVMPLDIVIISVLT